MDSLRHLLQERPAGRRFHPGHQHGTVAAENFRHDRQELLHILPGAVDELRHAAARHAGVINFCDAEIGNRTFRRGQSGDGLRETERPVRNSLENFALSVHIG